MRSQTQTELPEFHVLAGPVLVFAQQDVVLLLPVTIVIRVCYK